MLSALTEQHLDAVGRYVAIGTDDDATARRSVDVVAAELQDPHRLPLITLEELVSTARRPNTKAIDDAGQLIRSPIPPLSARVATTGAGVGGGPLVGIGDRDGAWPRPYRDRL